MTILFDSSSISAPESFGLGLVDVARAPISVPTRRRGPSMAEELYWQAFNLAAEGEDPATPKNLTADERRAWTDGLSEGEAERWADYEESRERQDLLASGVDVPAWAVDEYRDAWGGHAALEA